MPKCVLLQGVFKEGFFDSLREKKIDDIIVLEGRPSLEAAKNNSREALKRKLKVSLIADNMSGFLFRKGMVKEVWLAFQSVEQNGVLCSIGALIPAVLAKKHNISVYVYKGIEQTRLLGQEKDIFYFEGQRTAPEGIRGYVPLVEWVPKKYITKIYSM